ARFSFDDLLTRAADTFAIARLADGAPAEAIRAALESSGRDGSTVAAADRDGRVALLSLRKDVDLAKHPALGQRPEVLRKTDVAVLHSGILEHVLGITPEAQAAKTNIWYP